VENALGTRDLLGNLHIGGASLSRCQILSKTLYFNEWLAV
jgi:hypothetical protein